MGSVSAETETCELGEKDAPDPQAIPEMHLQHQWYTEVVSVFFLRQDLAMLARLIS